MIARRFVVSLVLIVSSISPFSSAVANNGITKYEDVITFEDYSTCLGENISGLASVTGIVHNFDTPSGTFHYTEDWYFTIVITGGSSANTWLARGASPYVENAGQGSANLQFTENWVAIPLSGDGPKLRVNYIFKLTVDANGKLVVFIDQSEGVDPIVCIGQH